MNNKKSIKGKAQMQVLKQTNNFKEESTLTILIIFVLFVLFKFCSLYIGYCFLHSLGLFMSATSSMKCCVSALSHLQQTTNMSMVHKK